MKILSIIIVSYNNNDLIKQCLDSLYMANPLLDECHKVENWSNL